MVLTLDLVFLVLIETQVKMLLHQDLLRTPSHMYGEAFDINWNTTAGKWIRKNAHKFGFIHADYKATSTHFNYTGQKTEEQPPSTPVIFQ